MAKGQRGGYSGKAPIVRYSIDAETRFAIAMAGRRYDEVPHVERPLVRLPAPDPAGWSASSAALAVDG